jgi:hypothetical protein
MNKISSLLLIALTTLFLACNNNKPATEENNAPSEPLVEHNLKRHGMPYMISLPKGKMQLLIDSMQAYGDLTIDMGKTFNIIISPANEDMASIKKDLAGNDVNKLKNYIIDEPTTILFVSEIVSPEYHFKHFVTIGTDKLMISDNLNADGTAYNEDEIKLMLACAKSLKAL